MMTRLAFIATFFALTGCAVQEEFLEEPLLEEDIAAIPTDECDLGDDDGIGGTGCEPVARRSAEP